MRCDKNKYLGGWDKEADIVIVGSGFAGLASAIEAHSHGVTPIIIEKKSSPGGNSIISDGGINAVDEERQKSQRIEDSNNLHFQQTYEAGNKIGDPEMIKYLVKHSLSDCIHWLENLGVKFPDEVVCGYGALWPRSHLSPKYKEFTQGAALIHAMLEELDKRGVGILHNHKLTKILREEPLKGRVAGIKVNIGDKYLYYKIRKALILASGGFASNDEWVKKHDRRLAGLDTTNRSGVSTGEVIRIAQDIGADTLHMDYIQAIPWNVKPPFKGKAFFISCKENDNYYGAWPYMIFLNKEGKRFINEDTSRRNITQAMLEQPAFEPMKSPITAKSIAKLESKLALPEGNLMETINRYNSFCKKEKDKDFGKDSSTLMAMETPPFKAEVKAPASHFTMGGLRIKAASGQVYDRVGKLIPDLYAAGEVTAGLHGAARLGYNAIPECILFGRLCGRKAATKGL